MATVKYTKVQRVFNSGTEASGTISIENPTSTRTISLQAGTISFDPDYWAVIDTYEGGAPIYQSRQGTDSAYIPSGGWLSGYSATNLQCEDIDANLIYYAPFGSNSADYSGTSGSVTSTFPFNALLFDGTTYNFTGSTGTLTRSDTYKPYMYATSHLTTRTTPTWSDYLNSTNFNTKTGASCTFLPASEDGSVYDVPYGIFTKNRYPDSTGMVISADDNTLIINQQPYPRSLNYGTTYNVACGVGPSNRNASLYLILKIKNKTTEDMDLIYLGVPIQSANWLPSPSNLPQQYSIRYDTSTAKYYNYNYFSFAKSSVYGWYIVGVSAYGITAWPVQALPILSINASGYVVYPSTYNYTVVYDETDPLSGSITETWDRTDATVYDLQEFFNTIFGEGGGGEVPEDPQDDINNSGLPSWDGFDGTHDSTSDDFTDGDDLPSDPTRVNYKIVDGVITVSENTCFNTYSLNSDPTGILEKFHQFMWSDTDLLQKLQNAQTNVHNCVLSCHEVPWQAPASAAADYPIYLAGQEAEVGTEVIKAQYVFGRYKTKTFGPLDIESYYGSYADMSPYSNLYIYLPFIGVKPLNLDEFNGKKIELKYILDNYTGAIQCNIYVVEGSGATQQSYITDIYNSACISVIPMSSNTYNQLFNGIVQIVTGSVTVGSAIQSQAAPEVGAVTGNQTSLAESMSQAFQGVGEIVKGLYNANQKTIQKGSSMSPACNWHCYRTPFLIYSTADVYIPKDKNAIIGYPDHRKFKVSDLSGYTSFLEIHADTVKCLYEERSEIEQLLKGGIII